MKHGPINQRETEFNIHEGFKDSSGQCHFPDAKLTSGQMDVVKLGKTGGYYPKMGLDK